MLIIIRISRAFLPVNLFCRFASLRAGHGLGISESHINGLGNAVGMLPLKIHCLLAGEHFPARHVFPIYTSFAVYMGTDESFLHLFHGILCFTYIPELRNRLNLPPPQSCLGLLRPGFIPRLYGSTEISVILYTSFQYFLPRLGQLSFENRSFHR